ncbi:WG repeat-containing protein [Lachnoclostridium sp.]|uniref:WG repeat-containing protein n=1 Tax=Lachnoclostridium sp. TaxID=2028282 RepID=UPI00289ECD68|nr:WG repeat-containing protein [Lachnoclostridium sp.]
MKRIVSIIVTLSILISGIAFSPAKASALSYELDYAGCFSENYAVVGVWEGIWKYGYINEKGKTVINLQFNYANGFSEGLAVVGMGKSLSSMKYGYIKKDGSYLFKPQFDYATDMKNGFAIVGMKQGDNFKYGLIDSKGNILIDLKYNDISLSDYNMKKGYAIVDKDNLYGIYNLKTKKLVEPKYNQILIMDHYVELVGKVDGQEKYGVLFFNDKVIEPTFDWIHHFAGINNVIGKVEKDGKYGVLGTDGKYILDIKYDEIREFEDGTCHIKLDGKYGYLNSDASLLTPIEYDEITAFHKGLSTVKKDGKYGILNRDGTYKAEPIYDQVYILYDKIEAILNGKKIILNDDGSNKYDKDYEYMYPFNSIKGASKVKKDGKEVIIDSKGKPIFKVDFDTISEFENGVAYIKLNGKIGYLGEDGKYVVKPIYDSVYYDGIEPYYHTKLDDLMGLVFVDGTEIKPMSNGPISFHGDYGSIRVNDKETYIDKKGKQITSELFDNTNPFSDGMGRVMLNMKTSYVNTSGKRINKEFDHGYDFSDGYACVYKDNYYRYIDKKGDYAFGEDAKYSQAKSFHNGLAAVQSSKGKWGYIDTKGKLVIDCQFNGAFDFDEKLAPVRIGDKFGFIDKTGKIVIKAIYDTVSEFEDGMASAWKGNKYYCITSAGKVKEEAAKNSNFKFVDGVAPVKVITDSDIIYYWGYIKEDGSWLVLPELNSASVFHNGEGYFYKNNKLGYVNKSGKIRWN